MAIEIWRELAAHELKALAEEGVVVDGLPSPDAVTGPESWREAFGSVVREAAREGYPYVEPSDLAGIRARRRSAEHSYAVDEALRTLDERIYGGWLGRCAGCLLGKPVEGWDSDRIEAYMKAAGLAEITDYLPWIETGDESTTIRSHARSWTRGNIREMARDDDLDYTALGLSLLETKGREFTPQDVARLWLERLPVLMTYTAERAAYRNLVNGLEPPESATFANPFREFIGAQIRADIFGYVSPGNPSRAAAMAWRDASVSHTKNGIYGAMWVAATIAAAFVADDVEEALYIGISEVPDSSRLYEAVRTCLRMYREGRTWEEALEAVQESYGGYSWVHTINNACVVALALLYGGHDFSKTVGLAVRGGWDTDCNGATAGSILGVMIGAERIPEHWSAPLNDTLRSAVAGFDGSSIAALAKRTSKLARAFTG